MSKLVDIQVLTNIQQMFDPKTNPEQKLWVVNVSDKGGKQMRGDVLMMVKDEDGTDIAINLPSTWLPIDLTQYAPIGVFAKATTFRNYIRSKLIAVVNDETAQKILSMTGAAGEKVRVEREIENSRGAPLLADVGTTGTAQLNIGAGGVQVSKSEDAGIQASSSDDLMNGNTPKMKSMLAKVGNIQIADLEARHADIVDFMISSSSEEIKALAAGLPSHTSPLFAYTDIALNAIVEGLPVTADLFANMRDAANGLGAGTEQVAFSVPG